MCFSATASFSAAAILSGVGVASIVAVKKKTSLFFLACIPLLFGLQQASEGLLWLHLPYGENSWTQLAMYTFMFFAFFVWPIWIPFALWKAEKVSWRKKTLAALFLLGCFWAFFQIYSLTFIEPTVQIVNQSIQYSGNYYTPESLRLFTIGYMLAVILPSFISSLHYVWFFGVFGLISAFISQQFYRENFTSVWCFFAALMSVVLYFALTKNSSKP